MSESVVDVAALYAALDAKRLASNLSWRGLAHALEVAPSTFSRMGQGKRPDVDTFATLLRWLGMPVEAFMQPVNEGEDPEPMAVIGTYLRMDKNLTPKSAEALQQLIQLAYERLREHPVEK